MVFAILEDYDKGDSLDEIARDFALFDELEIRTWRGSFGWDDCEPSRRAYDFTWLEQFASLAADRRITLRPYIGYTPMWAAKRDGKTQTTWNRPPANVERRPRSRSTTSKTFSSGGTARPLSMRKHSERHPFRVRCAAGARVSGNVDARTVTFARRTSC
jgi:hypothetical protein